MWWMTLSNLSVISHDPAAEGPCRPTNTPIQVSSPSLSLCYVPYDTSHAYFIFGYIHFQVTGYQTMIWSLKATVNMFLNFLPEVKSLQCWPDRDKAAWGELWAKMCMFCWYCSVRAGLYVYCPRITISIQYWYILPNHTWVHQDSCSSESKPAVNSSLNAH